MICCAEQNIQLRPAEGISGKERPSPFCATTSAGCFIGDKMKRIPLTQGQFAIVDDENYEWLNQWKWCAAWNEHTRSFYAKRKGKTKNDKWCTISMAREIIGLNHGDKRQADHINHATLDNRNSNLRIVTHQQNNFNQRNTKGYCWDKSHKKYRARIRINGKIINLGRFVNAEKARNAYLEAKKYCHKF